MQISVLSKSSPKRKFKVKRVKSWRQIPCPKPDSTVQGYASKGGTLYVVKGTDKGAIEHEKFHFIKNHSENPRTYKTFIDQELEAWEYAWKKSQSPLHIKQKIRAIFNDCLPYVKAKQVTPLQTIKYIKQKLYSLDIPDSWKQDYDEVLVEFKKIY